MYKSGKVHTFISHRDLSLIHFKNWSEIKFGNALKMWQGLRTSMIYCGTQWFTYTYTINQNDHIFCKCLASRSVFVWNIFRGETCVATLADVGMFIKRHLHESLVCVKISISAFYIDQFWIFINELYFWFVSMLGLHLSKCACLNHMTPAENLTWM